MPWNYMRLSHFAWAWALSVLLVGARALAFETEVGPAKLDLDATAKLRTVLRFDSATPPEDPTFDLGVNLGIELGSRARIVTRSLLRFDGTVKDPENDHHVHDLRSTFQDSTPYLELGEAFLDVDLPASEVRLGIQKYAWGKLDALNPTDHLNPLDLTRPLDEIESAQKIGVPSVDVKILPEQITSTGPFEMMVLEGVLIPMAVPFRLPTKEERWYPPLLEIPKQIVVDPKSLSDAPPFDRLSPFPVGTSLGVAEGDPPDVNAANLQWAFQWTSFVGGVDVDLSYFDGFDTLPTGDLSGTLTSYSPGIGVAPSVSADLVLTPRLDRIRVFGGGFSASVWDLTVKGNFAYIQDRRFNFDIPSGDLFANPRFVDFSPVVKQFLDDFPEKLFNQTIPVPPISISVERDSTSSGLQVEYVGDEWSANVAGYLDVMFGRVPGLIQEAAEGRLLVQLRKSFLRETLTVDLVGVWVMARGEVVVTPTVTYQVLDGLTAEAGVLVIEGPRDGLLGEFRSNDEAFAQVTYAWQ